MFIECNITLSIANHPTFKKVMEKYTGKPIPSRGSIIKLMEDVGTDGIYRNTYKNVLSHPHQMTIKLSVKSIKYLLISKWNSEFCTI
uniref:Putative LOC100899379 [Metaseiulus occidentalis] n=1 Tax=Lepeophtheirus salmonis TaxID=72036 RepID=A0A0K2UMI6_LEPSM